MSADYKVLAPIYDQIGMADFATNITPNLLRYAQENGWLGRRILDLGCGTGASSVWFATNNYYVISVDQSPDMLSVLNQTIEARSFSNIRVINSDIRHLEVDESADMALAVDVFNDLDNVRDLEAAFNRIHQVLPANKWFIFDLHTVEGLVRSGLDGDRMIFDDESLVVFARTYFDYERQIHTQNYHIFRQEADMHWQRYTAQRVLRAYPIQGVATLLRRTQFELISLMNTRLAPVDLVSGNISRVIFVAKRL